MRLVTGALLLALTAGCAERPERAAPPSPAASPRAGSPIPAGAEEPAPTAAECVDATITGRAAAVIRQVDDGFSPSCLVVLGGQGLLIRNEGTAVHNFSVEGTGVDIDVQPETTARTEAIAGALPAGTHTFFCKYHRSRGMEGEITVSQAG